MKNYLKTVPSPAQHHFCENDPHTDVVSSTTAPLQKICRQDSIRPPPHDLVDDRGLSTDLHEILDPAEEGGQQRTIAPAPQDGTVAARFRNGVLDTQHASVCRENML